MTQPGAVLVTGPNGFIGRAVVAAFASAGYRVVGIGDSGGDAAAAVEGVDRFVDALLPNEKLDELMGEERPGVLVHTAGPASVAGSLDAPAADFRASVDTWVSVLDSVRMQSPETKVVFLSSAAVYGNPAELPVPESAPITPVSPYGYHKWISEIVGREFHDVYGVSVAFARVFSAYGPGLRRQVVWDIACKAAASDRVELFGTGDETRDFIHIGDVAAAVLAIAGNAPFAGEAYNVASGDAIRIRDLAVRLADLVNASASVEFNGEARPGDPDRWQADIAVLRSLGYAPSWSLSAGLEDFVAWFERERRDCTR